MLGKLFSDFSVAGKKLNADADVMRWNNIGHRESYVTLIFILWDYTPIDSYQGSFSVGLLGSNPNWEYCGSQKEWNTVLSATFGIYCRFFKFCEF